MGDEAEPLLWAGYCTVVLIREVYVPTIPVKIDDALKQRLPRFNRLQTRLSVSQYGRVFVLALPMR